MRPTASVPCSSLLNANIGQGQICSNTLPHVVPGGDVTSVPWTIGGAPVGVTYLPPGMSVSTTTSFSAANVANPTYFADPDLLHLRHGPIGRPDHSRARSIRSTRSDTAATPTPWR